MSEYFEGGSPGNIESNNYFGSWEKSVSSGDQIVFDEYNQLSSVKRGIAGRIAKSVAAVAIASTLIGGGLAGYNKVFGSEDSHNDNTPRISKVNPFSPTSTPDDDKSPIEVKNTPTPPAIPTEIPSTPSAMPDVTRNPEVTPIQEHVSDFISPEVLRDVYHVNIFDLGGEDFVKLKFRENAIEMNPLFNQLKESNDQLYIFLLDGPTVSSQYLDSEHIKAHPEIVEMVNDWGKKQKEVYMDTYEATGQRERDKVAYEEAMANLQMIKDGGNEDLYSAYKQACDYRFQMYLGELTEEFVLNSIHGVEMTRPNMQKSNEMKEPVKDKYIFVPVRAQTIEFTSGDEIAAVLQVGNGAIDPENSYPNPALDFTINSSNTVYPVENGGNIAFIMEHELAHAAGISHPDADYVPYKRMEKAFEMSQSGDNSGYYIVFETPKGQMISQTDNQDPLPVVNL